MTRFSSFIGRLFRGRRPANPYHKLRGQLFATTREGAGISADGVWGVVVETGYREGSATLVALADGTASMYYSTGGGVIGAGRHEKPNAAAKALIRRAADFVSQCSPINTFPLPRRGETRFYLFMPAGKCVASAPEAALGDPTYPLFPLFAAAHELIMEIQVIGEAKAGK
jgi:hypothetical protein